MKSIAPKAYLSLPRLAPPAGYICVIRDIDSDRFRIDGAAQPQSLMQSALQEVGSRFGIELVSILETDDLAAAQADLHERYQARLSSAWLELDPWQLAELRRSILQIDSYPSQYLTPQNAPTINPAAPAKQTSTVKAPANTKLRAANSARWKRPRMRAPLPDRRYGARSLRRHRDLPRHPGQEPLSLRDRADQYFEDILVNHPGIVISVLLTLTLILIIHISQCPHFDAQRCGW